MTKKRFEERAADVVNAGGIVTAYLYSSKSGVKMCADMSFNGIDGVQGNRILCVTVSELNSTADLRTQVLSKFIYYLKPDYWDNQKFYSGPLRNYNVPIEEALRVLSNLGYMTEFTWKQSLGKYYFRIKRVR